MIATSCITMGHALARTTIAVKVTGLRRARVRIWVGTGLMRVAALVIGSEIDINLTATAEKND